MKGGGGGQQQAVRSNIQFFLGNLPFRGRCFSHLVVEARLDCCCRFLNSAFMKLIY